MALTELEVLRTGKAMNAYVQRKRPPEHVRDQVDIFWSLDGQSVYLLEKRRLMDGQYIERPFAKATYVRTQKIWKIYWQRADLKWHSYEPVAAVKTIDAFCKSVDDDPYGCFWG